MMPTKGEKRQRDGPVCLLLDDDRGHLLFPLPDAATQRREKGKKKRKYQKYRLRTA